MGFDILKIAWFLPITSYLGVIIGQSIQALVLPFTMVHESRYASMISTAGILATVHLVEKVAAVILPPDWPNRKHKYPRYQ